MRWRKVLRDWTVQRGRQVQRVAAQGYDRARQAGRVAAHKILAVQKAARLPQHLIRRSAQSVALREPARASDAAWRDAYMQAHCWQASPPPAMTDPGPWWEHKPPAPADMEAGQ